MWKTCKQLLKNIVLLLQKNNKKIQYFTKLDYLMRILNLHSIIPTFSQASPHGCPNIRAVNGSNFLPRYIHFSNTLKAMVVHIWREILLNLMTLILYLANNIHLMWVIWCLMHVPSFDRICYHHRYSHVSCTCLWHYIVRWCCFLNLIKLLTNHNFITTKKHLQLMLVFNFK